MEEIRRGWHSEDVLEFTGPAYQKLNEAAVELCWLLDRGYPEKPASVFVSNHHLLSERQRIALVRMSASSNALRERAARKLVQPKPGIPVQIDAFNEIILLETALAGSLVLKGMDGCYRDLAGLHGTYRIIASTDDAIRWMLRGLQALHVQDADFWMDAPVSNSGRLKEHILAVCAEENFSGVVHMVNNPDAELAHKENVISADSVILDRCLSWINLNELLIPRITQSWVVGLKPPVV